MQLENQAYKKRHLILQVGPTYSHTDDIFIIGMSLTSKKEATQIFEEASKEVGLAVNKGKTKYMVAADTQNCSKSCEIEIG